jgi:cytochrome c-type biogenesis protein CcmH/NrfF
LEFLSPPCVSLSWLLWLFLSFGVSAEITTVKRQRRRTKEEKMSEEIENGKRKKKVVVKTCEKTKLGL